MQPPPDRYQLVRRLGATPQVQSYEAKHPRRPGRFLVEVLGCLRGEGPAREAFERDLAAISQLRHPYMLQALELSQLPDGTPIMVSELPDGQTLQVWLDRGAVAPLPSVLGLIDALAQALQAAHARGVTHGTLDAASVFLIPNMGSGLGIPRLHGFGRHWLLDQPAADPVRQDMSAFADLAGRLLNPALPGLEDVLARARDPEHPMAIESPEAFNEALQEMGQAWKATAPGDDAGTARPPGRRRRSVVRMGLSASGLVTAAFVAVVIAGGLEPQLQHLSTSLVLPGRAMATAVSPALATTVVMPPTASAQVEPPPPPAVEPIPAPEPQPAPSVMFGPEPPLAGIQAPAAAVRRVRPRRAPEPPAYRGLVWSSRLNRLVQVDELGLPLDAEFPSGEQSLTPEPLPVVEPPLPVLPALGQRP